MKAGERLLDRYEIENPIEVSHYPGAAQAKLEAYRALDVRSSVRVAIKIFPIPSDKELSSFASALWDREVRITHLATSGLKGKALLRLLDARRDRENAWLILVTETGGRSLAELLRERPRPSLLLPDSRPVLWQGFLELSRALEALHTAGLIHRNVSPEAIYLDDTDSEPLLRLGDFSWSVYLHGLSRMVKEPSASATLTGTSAWSVYVAPEAVSDGMSLGESFRSDIFSLGLVMAQCFVSSLTFQQEEIGWLASVRNQVNNAEDLGSNEKLLILRMIDPNPSGRPANAADVADQIRLILTGLRRDVPLVPDGPLTVVFDTRPGSAMWEDLKKWINVDGLGARVPEFMREEFTGAKVYFLPGKRSGLWVEGRSGTPYALNPYFNRQNDRENLAVAGLWPLPFVPVVDGDPLLILTKGVAHTARGWETPRGPAWTPYFLHARREQSQLGVKGPRELFVDRLQITLEAERELTARQIYPYRATGPPTVEGDRQYLEVELAPEVPDPEFGNISRPSVDGWYQLLVTKGSLEVELSDDPSPIAPMKPDRRWRLMEKREGNRLLLEKRVGRMDPPSSGWLRPWDLVYLVPLLLRKQRIVRLAELDDYLLQSLVEPGSVTIFPGTAEQADLSSTILGARPLFLLQGPPGTGKTYWASQVIQKMLEEDETARILVSSQAHKPLDHLMAQAKKVIAELNLDPPPILLRLTRKQELATDELSEAEEDIEPVTRRILERSAHWNPETQTWRTLSKEWRDLVKMQLESPSPAWERIVRGGANIVFLTSTSSALRELETSPPFDIVIIEEAGKAYATELLPPMRLGRRWLIIGDQQQLPPFLHHEMLSAAQHRLEQDADYQAMSDEEKAVTSQLLDEELQFFGAMFKRVQTAAFPQRPKGVDPPALRLKDQWRMPPLLSEMISSIYYGEVFTQRTPDRPLPIGRPAFLATSPLVWINTPFCATAFRRAEEHSAPEGGYTNRYEVRVIESLLRHSIPTKPLGPGEVVVLSPYLAQVRLLRSQLSRGYPALPDFDPRRDVHSVDSFQGRQAPVVVVSVVRNNDHEQALQALGFLTQDERMNVLLSRGSHQLVVVGCLELLENFLGSPEAGKIGEVARFVRSRGSVVDARTLLEGFF